MVINLIAGRIGFLSKSNLCRFSASNTGDRSDDARNARVCPFRLRPAKFGLAQTGATAAQQYLTNP